MAIQFKVIFAMITQKGIGSVLCLLLDSKLQKESEERITLEAIAAGVIFTKGLTSAQMAEVIAELLIAARFACSKRFENN